MTALAFNAADHTYHLGQRQLPGVTSVLQPYYDGLEYVDWQRLKMLAEFGNHVHLACHLHNTGELDEDSLDPVVATYLAGWKLFLRQSGYVVTHSEERVYHKELLYAGTLDNVGHFPPLPKQGRWPCIVDIKTGLTMPRTVGPQTAAYMAARGKRMRRFCCLVGPETYKLVELKDPRDFDIFKAALTLYRWRTGL